MSNKINSYQDLLKKIHILQYELELKSNLLDKAYSKIKYLENVINESNGLDETQTWYEKCEIYRITCIPREECREKEKERIYIGKTNQAPQYDYSDGWTIKRFKQHINQKITTFKKGVKKGLLSDDWDSFKKSITSGESNGHILKTIFFDNGFFNNTENLSPIEALNKYFHIPHGRNKDKEINQFSSWIKLETLIEI